MRGFWYLVEALIGGIVLMAFLVTIGSVYLFSTPSPDINARAYVILHNLDRQDLLRNYTVALDYNGLNSQIDIAAYNHSIQICDTGGTCAGQAPSADNVWTGGYIISGYNSYEPYEVKLYLWED